MASVSLVGKHFVPVVVWK
uniref:Uncharacterized protein n=1 Tax=Anguilla anguilla TaxID=7936 RepID=A0A0E9U9N1_ANGAN